MSSFRMTLGFLVSSLAVNIFVVFASEHQSVFAPLSIPAGRLPDTCMLKPVGAGGASILPATKNPNSSSDKNFIRFLALFVDRGKKLVDVENVQSAYSAIYYQHHLGHEIGIYGLYFKQKLDVETIKRLAQKQGNVFVYVINRQLVALLWQDSLKSSECFAAIREVLGKRSDS